MTKEKVILKKYVKIDNVVRINLTKCMDFHKDFIVYEIEKLFLDYLTNDNNIQKITLKPGFICYCNTDDKTSDGYDLYESLSVNFHDNYTSKLQNIINVHKNNHYRKKIVIKQKKLLKIKCEIDTLEKMIKDTQINCKL